MSGEKKLYVDKVAPAIPEWYAAYRYDPAKSARETYIDNALNPFLKAYSFYSMRESMKRKLLEEAKEMDRKRNEKIKEKQIQRARSGWRNRVNFVL